MAFVVLAASCNLTGHKKSANADSLRADSIKKDSLRKDSLMKIASKPADTTTKDSVPGSGSTPDVKHPPGSPGN